MKRCIPELSLVKVYPIIRELISFVISAAANRLPAHEVEKGLFDRLLQFGQVLLQQFFQEAGDGDDGESIQAEVVDASVGVTTRKYIRTKKLRQRQYRSIFGAVTVERYGYSDGEVTVYPFDQQCMFPRNQISYLLQQWVQGFCVHDSFAEATAKLDEILGTSVSVRKADHLPEAITW